MQPIKVHISSVRVADILEEQLAKHLADSGSLDDYQRGFADGWRQVAEFIRRNANQDE